MTPRCRPRIDRSFFAPSGTESASLGDGLPTKLHRSIGTKGRPMPKIDIKAAPMRLGGPYPPPLNEPCKGRRRWKLGVAAGLTQFGVNLTRLPPGQWTSQRHCTLPKTNSFGWSSAKWCWSATMANRCCAPETALALRAACPTVIISRTGREAMLLEVGSRRPGRMLAAIRTTA